jgi:sec-independent protein translocase protein TatA
MQHPIFALGLPHGFEWLWIALIVVLLFGADKLPKLARGLGKSLGEFKKAKEEFDKELHTAASEPEPKKLEGTTTVASTPVTTSSDEPAKKS